ncbi:MAG: hypothetical protein ICV63_13770 [Coleofasciculus sp. Co-bin14]|nr:hypothetical protein [Coleofasciculus sp. Co-bin14]
MLIADTNHFTGTARLLQCEIVSAYISGIPVASILYSCCHVGGRELLDMRRSLMD